VYYDVLIVRRTLAGSDVIMLRTCPAGSEGTDVILLFHAG
jgi:hypothetical protein